MKKCYGYSLEATLRGASNEYLYHVFMEKKKANFFVKKKPTLIRTVYLSPNAANKSATKYLIQSYMYGTSPFKNGLFSLRND